MSDMKVRIKFGNAEIEVEGAKTDVEAVLGTWWLNISEKDAGAVDEAELHLDGQDAVPKRQATKRSTKKSPATSGSAAIDEKFDANGFANRVKQAPGFPRFREAVLHGTSAYDKVALMCYLSDEPLTSGDIQRTLNALGVKMSIPNVSNLLAKRSSDFMNSVPRKLGGTVARYQLTSHAKAKFEATLNATSGRK